MRATVPSFLAWCVALQTLPPCSRPLADNTHKNKNKNSCTPHGCNTLRIHDPSPSRYPRPGGRIVIANRFKHARMDSPVHTKSRSNLPWTNPRQTSAEERLSETSPVEDGSSTIAKHVLNTNVVGSPVDRDTLHRLVLDPGSRPSPSFATPRVNPRSSGAPHCGVSMQTA